MNEILTFSLVSLLLVISPGPNGFLVLKTASLYGRNATAINLLGTVSATFCHGALSIFGLSALLLQSSDMFLLVKLVGAAYLFFIGAKAIYGSYVHSHLVASSEVLTSPSTIKKARGVRSFYMEGFFTQMLNPKVSMFYLAAFPQFLSFDSSSMGDAFILVAIHAGMIFLWFIAAAIAIDKVKKLSAKPSLSKWLQRVSGCLMIYFSGLLLAQKI